jgi:hypothetical protein
MGLKLAFKLFGCAVAALWLWCGCTCDVGLVAFNLIWD